MRGFGTGLLQVLQAGFEIGDGLVDAVDLEVDDRQLLMADPRAVEDAADVLEKGLHEALDVDDLVLDALLGLLPLPDLLLARLEAFAVLLFDALDGGVEDAHPGLDPLETAVDPVTPTAVSRGSRPG